MAINYLTSFLVCIFLEGGWEDEVKETILKDSDVDLFVLERTALNLPKYFCEWNQVHSRQSWAPSLYPALS